MDKMDQPTQFHLPLGVNPDSGEKVNLPVGPRGRTLVVVGKEGSGKTVVATKLANRLARAAVPGERVTVITPPYHEGYADLARRVGGLHVDLTPWGEGDDVLPEGAEETPFLSVALAPPAEADGGSPSLPWEALEARLPAEGRPSHLLVDPLHGFLERLELLVLMMRWANVPAFLGAAGVEEEDAVETASLVAATVSPFVPFRLPEGFGTLLLMQSSPEQVTDKLEHTVLGPVLTGEIVKRAWYRYEFSDDALPLEHLASVPPGEGVLLEVPMDAAQRQTPLYVDLGEDERRVLGIGGSPRKGHGAPADLPAQAARGTARGPQRPGRSGGPRGRRRADGGMTVRGGPGPRARTYSPENATGARLARLGLRDLLSGVFGRRRSDDRGEEGRS